MRAISAGRPAASGGSVARRGWLWVVAAATGLALVSLISNLTSEAQLSGQADLLQATRLTVSKVVNSGTAWAGLGIVAGWLVRRVPQAVLAGLMAGTLALLVHYGLGRLLGVFPPEVWASNSSWFLAAAITGGPLGLIGAAARRPGLLGVLARLVVPVAALAEPVVVGMFTQPQILPWPDRASSAVAGGILLAGGLIGLLRVLLPTRASTFSAEPPRPCPQGAEGRT